jgi:signal transduction histidine kinase
VALAPDLRNRTHVRWLTRLARGMAWGCCAYYLLLALLGIPFVGRPTPDDLLGLLVFLAYPIVGALIIARYPGHTVGWLFSAFGVFFATVGWAEAYVTAVSSAPPGTLPGGDAVAWLWNVLTAGAPFFFGTFLPLVFPTGRLPSPRWRPLAWVAAAGAIAITLSAAFSPGTMRVAPTVENPLALTGVAGEFFAALRVAILLAPVCDTIAVASQLFRLRRARGDERQQLKWMLSAAITVALGFASTLALTFLGVSGGISQTPVILSYVTIPVAAGVAIFRYRLYDIDIIINRTLVYAALTGCIVALYSLVVAGAAALFQTSGNLAISLVATGLVAVLFQPLRARLQYGVNRLLYGERDEPYAVISRLGRRLEGTLAPDAVLPTIVATVREALKLPYTAIALRQDGHLVTVAVSGVPVLEPLRLPMIYQQEPLGELILAPRASGEAFGPADRRLLDDLVRQAGVAAHAVRLTADLRHSRERIVAAREEERRRLRRDLHDGLGPMLASLTLKVDVADDLLDRNPAAAHALLRDLKAQAQVAIVDIRRLVYALRPPALDDLGLVGALHAEAGQYELGGLLVVVEESRVLPALPAAVEVAAYRVAQEALTNVVRHAAARSCSIRLAIRDGALDVVIVDDGRGLPADLRSGVGLTSMRERAEELGGQCAVESLPEGGTRVHAVLPLACAGAPTDADVIAPVPATA